jgi:hypothetical protein
LCYITAFRGGKDDSSLVVTEGSNGVNWHKGFYLLGLSKSWRAVPSGMRMEAAPKAARLGVGRTSWLIYNN